MQIYAIMNIKKLVDSRKSEQKEENFMRWIYVNNDDNSSRYILGTEGKKSLICFGINPSTAEPENLDNTLKSVERLTKNNGFDSWIMLNVYPQRATNPKNLHKDMNEELHKQNLKEIENVLKNSPVIWAAWGTLIKEEKVPTEMFKRNC